MKLTYPVMALGIVFFVGVFVSTTFHVYDRFNHFDKLMHFAGGFAVAWFVCAMYARELRMMHPSKFVLLLVAVTTLVGVLWEFAEFLSNTYAVNFPVLHKYLYGGGIADTLGDLLTDALGALVFSLGLFGKKRE